MQENCTSFLDSSNLAGPSPVVGLPDRLDPVDDNGTLFAKILDSLDQDSPNPSTLSAFDNIDLSDMSDIVSGDEQMLEYLTTMKPKVKKDNTDNELDVETISMANNISGSEESSNMSFRSRRKTRQSNRSLISEANTIVIEARTLMNKSSNSNKSNSSRHCSNSDVSDNENRSTGRDRCMSKNAITARINRQKQKERFESLQNDLAQSIEENTNLKKELIAKTTTINNLSREVQYLRSVLANQSCIANIIKQMPSVPGMYFLVNNDMSNKVDVNDNNVSESAREKTGQKRKLDSADFEVDGTSKAMSANENTKITSKGVYVVATGSTSKKSKTDDMAPETSLVSTTSQLGLDSTGGVCLHVSNNVASLEFCAICAESASNGLKQAGDHTYIKKEV